MFVYVYCLCLLWHTRTEWFLCGRKCARFCKVGCIIIFFSRHTAFAVVTCDGSYTRERPMLIDTSPDRPHINAVMRILFTCQSYRICPGEVATTASASLYMRNLPYILYLTKYTVTLTLTV